MTISSAATTSPPPAGHTTRHSAEQHGGSSGAVKSTSAERHDERRALIGLAGRVLGTWGHTARLLAIVTVVLGVFITGLWLLQVEVDLGPLHIGRH